MPRQRGTASAVNVVTTAETILATLPGINPALGQPVDLEADIDFTTGASVTGVTINVRRGTLVTSPLVQAFGPIAIAAATRGLFSVNCTDSQAVDVANQQYVVTIVQVAATGNGTGNFCYIRADWG